MKIYCIHTSWYGNASIFFSFPFFLFLLPFLLLVWIKTVNAWPSSRIRHWPLTFTLLSVCVYKVSFSDCASLHGMMPGTGTVLPLPWGELLSVSHLEHRPYWIRETFMTVSNCKESGREWQGVLFDNTCLLQRLYSTGGGWMKCKYGALAHDYWQGKVVVEKPVTLPYCGVLSFLNSRASFCRNLVTCSHVQGYS